MTHKELTIMILKFGMYNLFFSFLLLVTDNLLYYVVNDFVCLFELQLHI
jgi:hypothetical protein